MMITVQPNIDNAATLPVRILIHLSTPFGSDEQLDVIAAAAATMCVYEEIEIVTFGRESCVCDMVLITQSRV